MCASNPAKLPVSSITLLPTAPRPNQPAGLRYSTTTCQLGQALLAVRSDATTLHHGLQPLAVLYLGDGDAELEAALATVYPRNARVRDDAGLAALATAVRTAIDTPALAPPIPLVLAGTAFQQRVWQALCAIPAGQTRSYSELTAELGDMKALRAVARANGANQIALLVPCHRVIGKHGALTGYRWGLARKQALLEQEGHRFSSETMPAATVQMDLI